MPDSLAHRITGGEGDRRSGRKASPDGKKGTDKSRKKSNKKREKKDGKDDGDDNDAVVVCGKPDVVVSQAEEETAKNDENSTDATLDTTGEREESGGPRRRRVKKKGIGERLKERSRNRQKETSDTASTTSSLDNRTETPRGQTVSDAGENELNVTRSGRGETAEEGSGGSDLNSADRTSLGSRPDTLSLTTEMSLSSFAGGDTVELLRRVCEAMALTEYSHDVREKADQLEVSGSD
jgi:hypothetical protein